MEAQGRRPEYDDFVVRIGPDDGLGHRLAVDSPAGGGSGFLRFPFSGAQLSRLAGSTETWRPRPEGKAEEPAGNIPPHDPRRLGQELFEALFPDRIRRLFDKSLGQAEERRRGLRIRLKLDLEDPKLRRLFSLPWELLRPKGEDYLVLSRETPIVRHPEVARPGGERPTVRKLRILAVLAQPEDQPRLDLEREWQALEEIWRDHPNVRLERCENPSFDRFLAILDGGSFHVLHFMGHGGFDPEVEEWVLCFQGDDHKTDYVSASQLGEELADFRRPLRLVVLNACESARVGDRSSVGTFPGSGVAAALASAGLTAIVAMQAPISDRAAVELSKALYHRLASGDLLEGAAAAARKAIRRFERRGLVKPAEWATPVVFLRSDDGGLFEVAEDNAGLAEPKSWNVSRLGMAALASGGFGLALLAGLGSLWVVDSPALQSAATVVAVVLGGLGWLARRLWTLYESKDLTRDLSQWIAARNGLLILLFFLPILALVGWARYGLARVDDLRCAPLGARPPGARRIAVVPWTAGAAGVEASRQERLWASDVTDQLAGWLRHFDSLQVVVWRDGRPEDLDPRCVDMTLSGRVWKDRGVHLRVVLTDSKLEAIPLERSDEPDDFGDIDHFQQGLILDVIETLGIERTSEQRQLLRASAKPEARRRNRAGVLAFLEDDLDAAETRLRGALLLDEQYSEAYNNLGLVLVEKELPDYPAAIEQFQRAIAINPRPALYYFNLGLALEKRATELHAPGSKSVASAQVRQLLQEAATAYGQAIDRNRAFARAYNNLGFTLLKLGELERAREQLEHGRKLATEEGLMPYFEKNLGRVALDQGAPARAEKHLERAVELHQEFPEALYFLARAQEALADKRGGLAAEACETLRRYVGIADRDPESFRRQDARKRLARRPCGD